MSILTRPQRQQLLDTLKRLPIFDNQNGRSLLLRDLPDDLVGQVDRSPAKAVDLDYIVDAADRWPGSLAAGEHPLQLLILNALDYVKGSTAEGTLKAVLAGLATTTATPADPVSPHPPLTASEQATYQIYIQNAHGLNFGGEQQIGDRVQGDKVGGDKVGGDKLTIGDVTNSAVAQGQAAQASSGSNESTPDLAQQFAALYRQIAARPEDPDVDQAELTDTVQKIEQEVGKWEQANPDKVRRWLRSLGEAAPDVLERVRAILVHPVAGVAESIRAVAAQAQLPDNQDNHSA